ncbi:MAG: zf-HC2 domain-containing protein [Lachnospiraceae bacterium]|nr:zf-HC2 domain-containing protein [Lachnospiraceae bacterium]
MSNKITCDMAKDLIPLYIDGLLSKDSEKAVREHIEGCKDCQQLVENAGANIDLGKSSDDGVKLFDKVGKKFKKEYIKKFIIAVVVFLILWVGATIYIIEKCEPIWPKSSVEGLDANLDVVNINGDLYIHQTDLYAMGEVCIVDFDFDKTGEFNFYLGEYGLHTLMPGTRGYNMNEQYQRLCDAKGITKVNYCKPDGTVIFTVWQQGEEMEVLGEQ